MLDSKRTWISLDEKVHSHRSIQKVDCHGGSKAFTRRLILVAKTKEIKGRAIFGNSTNLTTRA